MKTQAGLWIDHREATIVTITDGLDEIKHIPSNVGKHVRYSGNSHPPIPGGAKDVIPEDQLDRKYMNQLNIFYDEVITVIREASSIQIYGPGEAKLEFEKRLEIAGLKERIVAIETADKLTDPQITARVREHLHSMKQLAH